MSIEAQLQARAGSKCELCASEHALSVYEIQPHSVDGVDGCVLVCETCRSGLASPAAIDVRHWYALRESMWSEHAAVKVLVYRVLKGLGDHDLSRELLSQLYLDEDTQRWADAGLGSDETSNDAPVLDSNGTALQAGDTVTLIKDLEVKGANFTAKRGTTVKGIALTDDPKYVEGRVNGIRIVLVAAYLKKA